MIGPSFLISCWIYFRSFRLILRFLSGNLCTFPTAFTYDDYFYNPMITWSIIIIIRSLFRPSYEITKYTQYRPIRIFFKSCKTMRLNQSHRRTTSMNLNFLIFLVIILSIVTYAHHIFPAWSSPSICSRSKPFVSLTVLLTVYWITTGCLLLKSFPFVAGSKYAMFFMKTTLATVIYNYRLTTSMRYEEIKLKVDLLLRLINGYRVKIYSRKKWWFIGIHLHLSKKMYSVISLYWLWNRKYNTN